MKASFAFILLVLSGTAQAAVQDSCAQAIQTRTGDVLSLFIDNPHTTVKVVSSTYTAMPLEVMDGEKVEGETYKVLEKVQVGEDGDAKFVAVESGVIAPTKSNQHCQVLYTSPGSFDK